MSVADTGASTSASAPHAEDAEDRPLDSAIHSTSAQSSMRKRQSARERRLAEKPLSQVRLESPMFHSMAARVSTGTRIQDPDEQQHMHSLALKAIVEGSRRALFSCIRHGVVLDSTVCDLVRVCHCGDRVSEKRERERQRDRELTTLVCGIGTRVATLCYILLFSISGELYSDCFSPAGLDHA